MEGGLGRAFVKSSARICKTKKAKEGREFRVQEGAPWIWGRPCRRQWAREDVDGSIRSRWNKNIVEEKGGGTLEGGAKLAG